MNKEIIWRNDGNFFSPFPDKYGIVEFLRKQYPHWMTCDEIAENLYGVSAEKVCDLISETLTSPGGKDVIEVQIDEQSLSNKYRFIKS